MTTDGTSLSSAMTPHGGHVMPAGMYLSWLSDAIAPYDFRVNAAVLLRCRWRPTSAARRAAGGCSALAPGILPPLALYLFTVFTAPLAVWWAAGINQFALHVALFWGLARTRVLPARPGRWAVSCWPR